MNLDVDQWLDRRVQGRRTTDGSEGFLVAVAEQVAEVGLIQDRIEELLEIYPYLRYLSERADPEEALSAIEEAVANLEAGGEFRVVRQAPLYEINREGVVRRCSRDTHRPSPGGYDLRSGQTIKPFVQDGTFRVKLMVDGRGSRSRGARRTFSLALFVAQAFLNRPPRAEARLVHLDRDPLNCRAENLAWR